MDKKLALHYYKQALLYIEISKNTDFCTGICHALTVAVTEEEITEDTVYCFDKYNFVESEINPKGLFCDLYEYKPKPKHISDFGYWFSLDFKGRETRINILKTIISKLENNEETRKTSYLSTYA